MGSYLVRKCTSAVFSFYMANKICSAWLHILSEYRNNEETVKTLNLEFSCGYVLEHCMQMVECSAS